MDEGGDGTPGHPIPAEWPLRKPNPKKRRAMASTPYPYNSPFFLTDLDSRIRVTEY